jgi:hypothetical protein
VDVAHVAYVANVSEVCCKHLFKMFHLFLDVYCNLFYRNVLYVLHICCNSMFQIFQLFQSYVVASGFMLQVVNLDVSCVSHTCCKCVFQMFHLLSDVCCIQIFFMWDI